MAIYLRTAWLARLGYCIGPADSIQSTVGKARGGIGVCSIQDNFAFAEDGEEHPSPTHFLDTGAACAYMALQALKLGWHAHGMVGFDHERACEALSVPAGLVVEAAFAIGRRGHPSQLDEALRSREKPSDRLPLSELAFEGHM